MTKLSIDTVVKASLDVDGSDVVAKIVGYAGELYGLPVYNVVEIGGELDGAEYSLHHGEIYETKG